MNAFLAFLTNPKTLTILEGAGQAIVTFAQHNKQHLGSADATVAEAGAAIGEAAAVASTLAPFKAAI